MAHPGQEYLDAADALEPERKETATEMKDRKARQRAERDKAARAKRTGRTNQEGNTMPATKTKPTKGKVTKKRTSKKAPGTITPRIERGMKMGTCPTCGAKKGQPCFDATAVRPPHRTRG